MIFRLPIFVTILLFVAAVNATTPMGVGCGAALSALSGGADAVNKAV
jgi:hypothetical protein